MGRLIRILVGSETGNAREVAKEVALELTGYNTLLSCRCATIPEVSVEIDDIDEHFFGTGKESEKLSFNRGKDCVASLFIVSTTGDGEHAGTMRMTWEKLREKKCTLDFGKNNDQRHFSVFGMGDSTYEKFNFSAKLLYNRLRQLGATPIAYRGLGDENDENIASQTSFCVNSMKSDERLCPEISIPRYGIYTELIPWVHQVCISLRKIITGDEGFQSHRVQNRPLPCIREFKFLHNVFETIQAPKSSVSKTTDDIRMLKDAIVKGNERITSDDHFQDVRHINLSVEGCEAQGSTALNDVHAGDLIGFFPYNSLKEVLGILPYITLPKELVQNFSSQGVNFENIENFLHFRNVPKSFEILKKEAATLAHEDLRKLFIASQINIVVQSPIGENGDARNMMNAPAHERIFADSYSSLLELLIFFFDLKKPPRRLLLLQIRESIESMSRGGENENSSCCSIDDAMHGNFKQATSTGMKGSSALIDIIEKMDEFCSCACTIEYDEYFYREQRTIAEFLSEFETVVQNELSSDARIRISFESLLSYCPTILPRMYSMSNPFPLKSRFSNSSVSLSGISITAAIAETVTPRGRFRIGHASDILARSVENSHLPRAFFRSGKLTVNTLKSLDPIIFCSTGVGIGVCRSIYLSRKEIFSPLLAENQDIILHGCRFVDRDFLYKSDILSHIQSIFEPPLNNTGSSDEFQQAKQSVAFSRATPGYKMYIQNLILNQKNVVTLKGRADIEVPLGKHLAQLIYERNATIFVCGSSKSMPTSLRSAFKSILCEYFSEFRENTEMASRYISSMAANGRLVMDTW